MNATLVYPVDLSTDLDGRTLARVPDLVGCVTDGADAPEALAEVADALEEALCAAMVCKEDIPIPSEANGRPTVTPSPELAAKVALYREIKAQGLSNVTVARMAGTDEKAIRRLLDPAKGGKIATIQRVLSALGRRLVIGVEDIGPQRRPSLADHSSFLQGAE